MTSIVVNCGNGGDWEFERDRWYWRVWIAQNVFGIKSTIKDYHDSLFSIAAHREGDKAIVKFTEKKDALIFLLKRPDYIQMQMIDWTVFE